jgi:hypothetical protein
MLAKQGGDPPGKLQLAAAVSNADMLIRNASVSIELLDSGISGFFIIPSHGFLPSHSLFSVSLNVPLVESQTLRKDCVYNSCFWFRGIGRLIVPGSCGNATPWKDQFG